LKRVNADASVSKAKDTREERFCWSI